VKIICVCGVEADHVTDSAVKMSVPLRSTKSGDAFDHDMKMQKVRPIIPFSAQLQTPVCFGYTVSFQN